MPTFPAPRPVTIALDQLAGTVQVVASERDDTVVTISPTHPGRASDVRLAQEVAVQLAGDVLTVAGPASLRKLVIGPKGSVDVTVEVPTGSSLSGRLAAGPLYARGPLDAVTATLPAGNASIEQAARLDLHVSAGSVVVGRVTGTADIRASAGSVRLREVIGQATVKSSAGEVTVTTLDGTLSVAGSHGAIVVGQARGTVEARTSSGGIRVDALTSGLASLRTAYGSVEVGVPEGTAAWVDAATSSGHVRNELTPTQGPGADTGPTAEIHATTSYGDIVIRRPESAA